ncbi:hypothetical protein GW17_00038027 [Ensete ventricosum]|nr:hypothetical protein GW17_00038027 [Ensete ventricosum]
MWSGARRELPEVDQGSSDMVGSSPNVRQKLAEVWMMLSGAHRVFSRGLLGSLLEFTDRLLRACRKFAKRMPGILREFVERDRELAEGSPEGCQKFTGRIAFGTQRKPAPGKPLENPRKGDAAEIEEASDSYSYETTRPPSLPLPYITGPALSHVSSFTV